MPTPTNPIRVAAGVLIHNGFVHLSLHKTCNQIMGKAELEVYLTIC